MAVLRGWPDERHEHRDPATGARIVQLTSLPAHHSHLSGAASPITSTGHDLLFVSDRAGGPWPQLFRMELLTGSIHQITNTRHLNLAGITPAANGRQAIAALGGEEGEVVAIDLETGDMDTLAVFLEAELDGCHLSASGEYVATIVRRTGEATITAVHTEGMRTVPIHENRRSITAARFSPDARNTLLYVAAPDSLCCVEFDGTGHRVAYSSVQAGHPLGERSGVQAFGLGTGESGEGVQASGPSGVPDFSSFAPTAEHPTPERLNASPPTWLGSGEEILTIPGPGPGPLLAVPREGGRPRTISAPLYAWARSDSSGRRIVAVAARRGEEGERMRSGEAMGEIVLVDPRSGVTQPIASHCELDARPCFGPEGRSVVFMTRDEEGYSQLFLIETDSSAGSSH